MKIKLFFYAFCCFSLELWAGQVRTIYTNDKAMKPIHLRMGKSTLLRFIESLRKSSLEIKLF